MQTQSSTATLTYSTSHTVELDYNITQGTVYLLSLQKSVVLPKEYNVIVNSEELIGTTEYLTL
jgi:hypothetical protein